MSQANPILLYHPDGYVVARQDLKGRHSAGESFLSAFLAQARGPDVYALCEAPAHFAAFAETVAQCGRPLSAKMVLRTHAAALRANGLVYIPHPEVAREARLRSFLGEDAYAICGVTHTISTRTVLSAIADLPVAPVMPWDALICTSKAVHASLSTVLDLVEADLRERLGAERLKRPMMPILPLGIHVDRFTRDEGKRAEWRAKLGIGDDTTAILFFGRLSFHGKASPFQLAQAAELAAKKSDRHFVVIWCGWFSDDYQRRVFMETAKNMAPSVAFHHVDGRSQEARFSIWSAADIFCSLSDNIQESFGLTVIEAMAAGLPVVASNWNGYREAVDHGESGVLVDIYLPPVSFGDAAYRYLSGADSYDVFIGGMSQLCMVDVEKVADWLARLSANPELRRTMGEAARRKVAAHFDWKTVLPRYGELWREQLARLEQARREPQRSATWRSLDPGTVFANFPSHRLGPESWLARGVNFDRWETIAKEPGIVAHAALLMSAGEFRAVRNAFDGKEALQVKDLVRTAAPERREILFRSLHWMVKIGLLALR